MRNIMKHPTSWYLLGAAKECSLDPVGLANNMTDATLSQLNEVVAYAEKLKLAAFAVMHNRELEASGLTSLHLAMPPKGYAGFRPRE